MGKITLNYGMYVQTNQTTFIPLKLSLFSKMPLVPNSTPKYKKKEEKKLK